MVTWTQRWRSWKVEFPNQTIWCKLLGVDKMYCFRYLLMWINLCMKTLCICIQKSRLEHALILAILVFMWNILVMQKTHLSSLVKMCSLLCERGPHEDDSWVAPPYLFHNNVKYQGNSLTPTTLLQLLSLSEKGCCDLRYGSQSSYHLLVGCYFYYCWRYSLSSMQWFI